MYFLITQLHEEDGAFDQELYEADTWQVALGMAQLGWALEKDNSYANAKAELGADGYRIIIKQVESYRDYKGADKIQLKDVV